MGIRAWPFLVSRNKSLGYQTIVAPDFMVDAKMAGLLAKEAGGSLTKSPRYCELRKTKVGTITLAYRVIRATDGDKVFRDDVGRPILWIEGVVLKDLRNKTIITDQTLQEAHHRVIDTYQEFWECNTSSVSIKCSQSFMILLQEDGDGPISTTRSDTKTENYAGKTIEGKNYNMTNTTSQFAIAIISVLLLAVIIFNVIQARKVASLEERLNNLEHVVATHGPMIEGSNILPTSTPGLE